MESVVSRATEGKTRYTKIQRAKAYKNITRIQVWKQAVEDGEWTVAGFSLTHRKEVRTSEKYMVIYRHKDKYSVSEMCRFFKVSRSGYYEYVTRMDKPAWDLPLAEKIRECQEKCGKTYGYRRVHIWLERNGIYRNPKTVLRVMQKYGWLSVSRRKKYRNYGKSAQQRFQSWKTESKMGYRHFIYTYQTRRSVFVGYWRFVWQQYYSLQDRNRAKHQFGFKHNSRRKAKRKDHRRVAAPQWPRLPIYIPSIFFA